MPDKPPFDSSLSETIPPPPATDTLPPPPSKGPFKTFPRRDKTQRAPSGRVLPPAPEWMQKPLKPPGVRFPTNE
jgi:hypothetical protein